MSKSLAIFYTLRDLLGRICRAEIRSCYERALSREFNFTLEGLQGPGRPWPRSTVARCVSGEPPEVRRQTPIWAAWRRCVGINGGLERLGGLGRDFSGSPG